MEDGVLYYLLFKTCPSHLPHECSSKASASPSQRRAWPSNAFVALTSGAHRRSALCSVPRREAWHARSPESGSSRHPPHLEGLGHARRNKVGRRQSQCLLDDGQMTSGAPGPAQMTKPVTTATVTVAPQLWRSWPPFRPSLRFDKHMQLLTLSRRLSPFARRAAVRCGGGPRTRP